MKILYFASLKESLNIDFEQITLDGDTDVADLRAILIKKHGKRNFPNNILCAVNHTIADDLTKLNHKDEVAFYPPVTGG